MRRILRQGLAAGFGLCVSGALWAASFTIDFESLPTLGTTSESTSFADANGGSSTFNGVTFDSRSRVIGDEYRIGGPAPNPPMGVPHSGQYFLNNGNTDNTGLLITTSNVLTQAWFGRNEYYGYIGGASQVTVTALGASGDLASVSLVLPDTFPYTGNLAPPNDGIGNGLPDPMVQMDTSSFLGLSGITGYRIDRVATDPSAGDWVADDFTFASPAAIPEPSTYALFGVGLLFLLWRTRSRPQSA
jgi:hypothetical protein